MQKMCEFVQMSIGVMGVNMEVSEGTFIKNKACVRRLMYLAVPYQHGYQIPVFRLLETVHLQPQHLLY